jgi:SAM-dependent methyltransferase
MPFADETYWRKYLEGCTLCTMSSTMKTAPRGNGDWTMTYDPEYVKSQGTDERAIDFDQVAHVYDLYVSTSIDIDFWADVACRSGGPRLEMMCGTGRISIALLRQGIAVEGLDYSRAMLDVFRSRAAQAGVQAVLYHADARDFELNKAYGLIFIAFHSIAEVVDNEDKLRVFRQVRRHLAEEGVFWISAHNPPARRQGLDGRLVDMGHHRLPATGEDLHVTGRYHLDPSSRIVTGSQSYVFSNGEKQLRHIDLPVRFHLIDPGMLEALLAEAGLVVTERRGNYDGAIYSPKTSPFFLACCKLA